MEKSPSSELQSVVNKVLTEMQSAVESHDATQAIAVLNLVSELTEGNGEKQKALGSVEICNLITALLRESLSPPEVRYHFLPFTFLIYCGSRYV